MQGSVLFQLCSLLAFGVLSWSTTQYFLVPVMCPIAIFEDSFVFWFALKEQCHDDFAVLNQFCAKIITVRL